MSEVETGFLNVVSPLNLCLPPAFIPSHRQAIHRYLRGQDPLSSDDWSLLIQAMDLLRRAEVVRAGRRETFAAVYDRLVDAVYSDGFIEQLLDLADPERESEPQRAVISQRIVSDLRSVDLWRADVPDSQLLVAFCLYWWQMFARGYAFEIAIYRDLTDSGIAYRAHDLRNKQARLSGHDLEVMGFRGDVKTSTYFVLAQRSETLEHDFYITRLYHAKAQRWYRVVWLKYPIWRLLDGEPTPIAYEAIWQVLPGVAQITLRGRKFIIVLYEEWKQRVITRQAKEERKGGREVDRRDG